MGPVSRTAIGLGLAVGLGCTGRAGFGGTEADDANATMGSSAGETFADEGGPPPSPPSPPSGDGDPMPEPLPPEPLPPMDTGDEGGGTFISPPPDGGFGLYECSILEQDCPPGEKCMPWANDGGAAWNATRCSPIAADPAGFGETCQVEGSATSGIDDCDLGLMCWNVDETLIGACVHQCMGTRANPTCPGRDEICPISGDGVLLVCLPECHPLADDCAIDEACVPWSDAWMCAPDASGEQGTHGDPCEFINACDPMHVCVGADALPDCGGAAGCCVQVCDVFDGTSDAGCAALDPALACEPWWTEGTAPAGYDHVGVCAVPS